MSSVRGYGDRELLDYVRGLPSFKEIPKGYWLLGVRSSEDVPDRFDDKFYLFRGEVFIMVTSGTTNPGLYSLKHYSEYNGEGSAVVKADEWYYGLWKYGKHKAKMDALVQQKPILYYRDNDKDDSSEELGKLRSGIIGINFHTASYGKDNIVVPSIGKWSYGCQVANRVQDYYKIIDKVRGQGIVSYCLIKEF